MRYERFALTVPQGATGVGTAVVTENLFDVWVQVTGIAGGASVTLEGSIDGTNYVNVSAPLIADGVYEVPAAVRRIRANRTVQGTGNPTLTLGGRNGLAD